MQDLQRAMGLADWDVSVSYVSAKELGHDRCAESHTFRHNKEVVIKMGRKEDFDFGVFRAPEYEDTFLHELTHVLLNPLHTDEDTEAEEIVVNDIVRAFKRYRALK